MAEGGGMALRRLRAGRGLTQGEMGKLVGENAHWVSKREIGETRITAEDVRRLAVALGLGPDDALALVGLAPEAG